MTHRSRFLFVAMTAALGAGAAMMAGPAAANDDRPGVRTSDTGPAVGRLASTAPPPPTLRPITRPGDYRFSFRHGGRTRFYLIHVPKTYRRAKPAPMLIAMHGGGGSAAYQARDEVYGIISKSEEVGFVAVFPNGVSPTRSGLLATWNAGTCCGAARDRKVDDVGFLRTVIARVKRQVRVDPRRIHATGMSNGGLMAYRLACEMPRTIRGVAPVAGTDNTLTCSPRVPVPVLHIHAVDDDHVPFNGGRGPAARDQSQVADFVSVPDTIAKWVRLDRAAPQPTRVLSVPGAYCDLYAARPGGAPVKLCVTEQGAHSWPGGGAVRGKTPSQAVDANDLMWEFFKTL